MVSTFEGKEFASNEANSFPLRVDPIVKRGIYENDRVASHWTHSQSSLKKTQHNLMCVSYLSFLIFLVKWQ